MLRTSDAIVENQVPFTINSFATDYTVNTLISISEEMRGGLKSFQTDEIFYLNDYSQRLLQIV